MSIRLTRGTCNAVTIVKSGNNSTHSRPCTNEKRASRVNCCNHSCAQWRVVTYKERTIRADDRLCWKTHGGLKKRAQGPVEWSFEECNGVARIRIALCCVAGNRFYALPTPRSSLFIWSPGGCDRMLARSVRREDLETRVGLALDRRVHSSVFREAGSSSRIFSSLAYNEISNAGKKRKA